MWERNFSKIHQKFKCDCLPSTLTNLSWRGHRLSGEQNFEFNEETVPPSLERKKNYLDQGVLRQTGITFNLLHHAEERLKLINRKGN